MVSYEFVVYFEKPEIRKLDIRKQLSRKLSYIFLVVILCTIESRSYYETKGT